MTYLETIAAVALCAVLLPVLAAQCAALEREQEKATDTLNEMSNARERINAIERKYRAGETLDPGGSMRTDTISGPKGEKMVAVFFSLSGSERYWIIGR